MEEKQSINKNIPEEELESTSGGTEEIERERRSRIMWEPRVFRMKRLRSWKPQRTPKVDISKEELERATGGRNEERRSLMREKQERNREMSGTFHRRKAFNQDDDQEGFVDVVWTTLKATPWKKSKTKQLN
jgi:hypothetical protein